MIGQAAGHGPARRADRSDGTARGIDARPDREEIRRIADLARYTPSGDNCQPFRMEWDGRWLWVSHDERRADHVMNPEGLASYLTIGCLLEAIEIAARSVGWEAEAEVLTPPRKRRDRWARISFRAMPERSSHGPARLLGRWTDRRPYQGGSLADPVFRRVQDVTRDLDRARVCFREPSERLIRYLSAVEKASWDYKPIHRGYLQWFRLSRREAAQSRDGMPWPSLSISYPTAMLLRPGTNRFWYQWLLNRVGFLTIFGRRVASRVRSSTAVGCTVVRSPDILSVADAGRVSMRAWLELNDAGYGFQPISIGTILVLSDAAGCLPQGLSRALAESVSEGRRLLAEEFGLAQGETPAWIFRTGMCPRPDPAARTPRRDLDDILSILA